jgi:hypothetical protein
VSPVSGPRTICLDVPDFGRTAIARPPRGRTSLRSSSPCGDRWGYEFAHRGEGRWNGVAILSNVGPDDLVLGVGGVPLGRHTSPGAPRMLGAASHLPGRTSGDVHAARGAGSVLRWAPGSATRRSAHPVQHHLAPGRAAVALVSSVSARHDTGTQLRFRFGTATHQRRAFGVASHRPSSTGTVPPNTSPRPGCSTGSRTTPRSWSPGQRRLSW